MVVDDLGAIGAVFDPDETYAPTIVDADAELTRPIGLQGFEPIAGR
jgi:hypothetical protein